MMSTRRTLMKGLLATPFAADAGAAQRTGQARTATTIGRCKLGKLEVSTIGLGVQNNARKYETTVPYRPEQIALIRAAYEHGVTFFDTAEAYGPHECERILGESIAPFRDKVVIVRTQVQAWLRGIKVLP